MRTLLVIFTIVATFIGLPMHAQKASSVSYSDSVKAANKARLDALRLSNEAKRDSMENARELQRQKRELDAEERKAKQALAKKRRIAPLTQEMAVGYRLSSDGWSVLVHRGFIKTEDADHPHTSYLWFDLSEKRSPKEKRVLNENFSVVNPGEPKPTTYKYGKINNFYQFKLGYGNSKPISGKLDKKSVTINWVYGAGLSIGLLKPYYLDILVPEGNTYIRKFDKYTEANKESFLDLNNQGTIVGGASFTKGIAEIKFRPGLALRSGFYFDYAASRKSLLGVEIGASAEIFTQKIPILYNSGSPTFFNIYADIRFGKRWE